MRCLLLLLCIGMGCLTMAQKKISYTGSIEGGLLTGDKPVSSFIFTTQGVAYRQYIFSLGSGIDHYPLRSVPLFAAVQRTFAHNRVQPFIQAAAGINFTGTNSKEAKFFYQYTDGAFRDGFFARSGGGLMLRAHKKLKLTLSAGYTYKTTSYHYAPIDENPWQGQIQPISDQYRYHRWYAGAGIRW